jgi:hypothetical protein
MTRASTFAERSLARALARDEKTQRSKSGCWPGTRSFRIDALTGRVLFRDGHGWSLMRATGRAFVEYLPAEGWA